MTDLAKLVVKLEAQTAEFQKRLDKSEKKVKRFGNTTKRSLNGIKNAFAALALGAFANKVIDSTSRQEAAFKQLEQGIASTNQAVGFSAKELANYAAELQAATTFGDEGIIEAQSKLVSFTKITGEEFKRTTELALDMSARFGTDASAAAIQLGKALNDPIANLSALSRAGIQFGKEQKDLIKTLVDSGDQVGAQKIILAELETQFGGSARAARDTFGGAIKGLNNAFGDLLESKSGLKESQKEIESLTTLLSDPKTKEAANNLVSSLIAGFSKLVSVLSKLPDLGAWFAQQIHGPVKLADVQEDLTEATSKLFVMQKEFNDLLADDSFLAEYWTKPLSSMGAMRDRLERLQEEILDLQAQEAALLSVRKPEKDETEASSPSAIKIEPNNVVNLDDFKQRADQIIAETTPKLAQLQAKINESVELFSKGLLNDDQFQAAIALYSDQVEQVQLKDIAQFEEKIARMEEQFLSEYELLDQQKTQRLQLVDSEMAQKILSEEKLNKLKLQIINKHHKDKKKLEDAAAQAELKTTLTVAHGVLGIVSAFAGKSFKAQKALAIAEGIINIIGGVTKALNNPYPANIGFAAQVASQGAGLLSTIKSTNMSSTGASLNASSGASSSNSFRTPSAVTEAESTSTQQSNTTSTKKVEFSLTVDEFTEAPMRKLIEKISETGEDLGLEFALRA